MKNIVGAVVFATVCCIGSVAFATSSTGAVLTGSNNSYGSTGVCSGMITIMKDIHKNTMSIKANINDLRDQHKGRMRQYIDKSKREKAHELNTINRKEIKLLHKKLTDQYYNNPISLSSTSYINQMVVLRKSFFDALQPLIATGKLNDFTTFQSDYLAMFSINRALKYQNITQRYLAYQSCGMSSIKTSVEKIKETIQKEHDKYDHEAKKGNPAKQLRKVSKLKEQFKRLAEKYEKRGSSVANIIKTALDELDEDEGDDEPNDK